ncbi:MAG: MBL fold metallo-hydrolase [Phaeodactylibacter xiamenensis]|uniref:Beta-lactamase n=1 Tax=Phaeodactylibacter xiamenensis TaxID=1524460 RepID=A0A098SFA5_9BACT|nr:MBL fold metallo-hydrolase [Phaeodactylibacter xiamenensis]KGE89642.1 beta-lactamase [Phaeodactylibacter xiamenensis]MCR9053491.1 MBL fold metallo-hydrolase [bacterium]
MTIHIIETGYFKLDGGAMFGVVPKTLWQKKNKPDENNLCTWSMRCLLIEHGERRILVDTGIGDKQDEKFRSHFEPHGEASLMGSLQQAGFEPESITDVLLTHLHFDHVGGAVKYDADKNLVPTFPNATYWSNEVHYNWAYYPNPREKASFLKENFVPLKKAGVLKFIDVQKDDLEWLPGIDIRFVYGHTEAMMVPIFHQGDHTLVYCADVIPSSFHIGMPYVMSYDLRPLDTMREKGRILEDGVDRGHYLFFEHDPATACVQVERNDRGRIAKGADVDVEALFQ